MIVLSERDVAALLPIGTAIALVERVMIAVSRGGATLPLRTIMDVGGGNRMGMMPGALDEPACYGIKLVSLFPDNPKSGRSSHQGAMVLFEPRHGAAVGMMNAGLLTALRTAAASAVATRALARPQASRLAIIGTGEQARHHLDAMLAVRPVTELSVAGRRAEAAAAFAASAAERHPGLQATAGTDVAAAVREADIVCAVTAAAEPVLCGDWIAPGTHVNAVGASIPAKREIDEALVVKARLFADYRPSLFAQAGEVIGALERGAIGKDHVAGEIGEVLAGQVAGRRSETEITLYRSLGIAAQDLACAAHCLEAARARGLGIAAPLD